MKPIKYLTIVIATIMLMSCTQAKSTTAISEQEKESDIDAEIFIKQQETPISFDEISLIVEKQHNDFKKSLTDKTTIEVPISLNNLQFDKTVKLSIYSSLEAQEIYFGDFNERIVLIIPEYYAYKEEGWDVLNFAIFDKSTSAIYNLTQEVPNKFWVKNKQIEVNFLKNPQKHDENNLINYQVELTNIQN